jgi:hypothetical protein
MVREYFQARRVKPPTRESKKRIRKRKNKIRAIPTAAAAIPKKPKIAATKATMKKTIAQRSMNPPLWRNESANACCEIDHDSSPRLT